MTTENVVAELSMADSCQSRIEKLRAELSALEDEQRQEAIRDAERKLQPWKEVALRFYECLQNKAMFLNSGHWAMLSLGSRVASDDSTYAYVRSRSGDDFACLFRDFSPKWQLCQTWLANEGAYYTRNREGCTWTAHLPVGTPDAVVFVEAAKDSGYAMNAGRGQLYNKETPEGPLRFLTPTQAVDVLRQALKTQSHVEALLASCEQPE